MIPSKAAIGKDKVARMKNNNRKVIALLAKKKYIQFGSVIGSRAAVIDDVTWEKIKSPAYTDIHGTCPEGKMDVMLPARALEMMGISNPKIGMELPIAIVFSEDDWEEFTFRLSGYYTEYIAVVQYGPPDAYFSWAFLDSISKGREWDTTLFLKQDDRIPAREVENRLYNDIRMRDNSQPFLGGNTAMRQAMFAMAGGFDIVFVLAAVILASVGLLAYNVLYISSAQSIREYGLLKALGTTARQLQAMVFLQVARTALAGSLFGAAAGVLITCIAMPALLSGMYLYRIGNAAGMLTFRPLFLGASVAFVAGVTFFSAFLAVQKALRLSPIEALNHMEAAAGESYDGKGVRKNKKRPFRLWQMAWRNTMRFKKRFFVSAICLTLGLVVSLAVIMVSKGSSIVNQIEYDYPDISVGTCISPIDYFGLTLGSQRKNEDGIVPLFPKELLEKIQSLPGIRHSRLVLLLMGIVNYINVTVTGLVVRKKEFAVMESVGLTGKQLRGMLVLEGIFYSGAILVMTGIFGSGVFYLIGKEISKRMGYFVFCYPVLEFAACIGGVFLSCVLIVLVLYRKYGEGGIAGRLRIYAD